MGINETEQHLPLGFASGHFVPKLGIPGSGVPLPGKDQEPTISDSFFSRSESGWCHKGVEDGEKKR